MPVFPATMLLQRCMHMSRACLVMGVQVSLCSSPDVLQVGGLYAVPELKDLILHKPLPYQPGACWTGPLSAVQSLRIWTAPQISWLV